MDRRDFLKSAAVLAAAQATATSALAAPEDKKTDAPAAKSDPNKPLIDTPPVLQNYAEESMGISFGVSALANGYVIYGEQPDLSDGKKVFCGGYRVTAMDDMVSQIRLTHLKPATTYYYKIGADRIDYAGGYKMKILGNEEDPKIYSFTTAGMDATPHFCVINDTHKRWPAFELVTNKIFDLKPSCVIWNGDACNTEETVESLKEIFLRPEVTHRDYAAHIPYLFTPGNHDNRGFANRHPERVWMFRQPEERSSRDWDLGRNFAVRMGDIAMIGLDTGEDKQDTNPLFCNLFASKAYRVAQTDWLRDALQRPEIKSAPYLVAFCHIPLYDPRPNVNPGDIEPADADPRYKSAFAGWQRTCYKMWGPLLDEAKCQLVITAHQHSYHRNEPNEEHSWDHIVGGGPVADEPDTKAYPTVIDGFIEDGKLKIQVYDVLNSKMIGDFAYEPRKVKKIKNKKK